MTDLQAPLGTPPDTGQVARVLMADRGDPLVGPLTDALDDRFDVVGHIDAELTSWERLLVAAATFRPDRRDWAERFFKSNAGVALRSHRARQGLAAAAGTADVVFQTHALFDTSDDRTVMYLDCTHRQSMEQWPDWNPLHGRALRRWLVRETEQYHRAAHLFAFSTETADSLVGQYAVPRDRVTVVGAGANLTRLPELPRSPRPASAPSILFVGNDFERKGGPRLVEAFARLRRRFPDARLRIAGTPRPLPAEDGVEQLGRIRGRDHMSQLYAEADVFCLPSYYDPFPGSLLEAMAHGLPCVVTATSGVPEIVGDDTALVVDRGPSMTGDLVAALEQLLADPDGARAMGRRGRARVEQHFQWSHVVDRMAPALRHVSGRADRTTPDPQPLEARSLT